MTVPALDTSNIGMFAYLRPATEVQLADVLPYLYSFKQFDEYVDGTMRIWDAGSESPLPNNHRLVNVRVRTDGYLMAWFQRKLVESGGGNTFTTDETGHSTRTIKDSDMTWRYWWESDGHPLKANELNGFTLKFTSGSLSGNEYTIESNTTDSITLQKNYDYNLQPDVSGIGADNYEIIGSIGNLIWWGKASDFYWHDDPEHPIPYSTTLGRAIYEMWTHLKDNSDNPSYIFDYTHVNYYNYEYTDATEVYIIGERIIQPVGEGVTSTTWYVTVPQGRNVFQAVCSWSFYRTGYMPESRRQTISFDYEYIFDAYLSGYYEINGYINLDVTEEFSRNIGSQHTFYQLANFNGRNKIGVVILI